MKVMKKLFLATLLFKCCISFSQVLINQNCTNFTLGNISATVDNTLPGQGGWRAVATTGTPLSKFQIVDAGGQNGKVIQLEGASTINTKRSIYYPGLLNSWATRIAGNDIIELEFDFFTGASTTSDTAVDVAMYNTDGTILLCGFDYWPINQGLYASAYSPAGNVYLDPPTPITLQPNNWYKLNASFNKTTGKVLFGAVVNGVAFNFFYDSAAAGYDVGELDFINNSQPATSSSITNQIDNIVVRAVATNTLENKTFKNIQYNSFSIAPNPASEFIKITNQEGLKIKNIEISDLNGRIIKSENFNNISDVELNLISMDKGVYLLKINSESGIINKKIIKN